MTITADGWFDFAVRKPGPANRRYPWDNSLENLYLHSMEGNLGSYDVMADPSRYPTAWSWTWAKDGRLIQYYPVWAGLAHGGAKANPFGPGGELEGGGPDNPGEPMTDAQIVTVRRTIADLEAHTGHPLTRVPGSKKGLVEHGEVNATACPSGRYARLYEALAAPTGGLSMEDKERLARLERIVAAYGIQVPDPADPAKTILLGGEDALSYAELHQWSAFLGIGIARNDIAALQSAAPVNGVPPHIHRLEGATGGVNR